MRFSMTAIALALAVTGVAAPKGAFAAAQEEQTKEPEYDLSKKVREGLVELQEAISYDDWEKVRTLSAEIEGRLKTDDDHALFAQMQANAAIKQKKYEEALRYVDQMARYGHDVSQYTPLYIETARQKMLADDYASAGPILDKVLAADPNNVNATVLKAESLANTGNAPKGIELLAKAIRESEAANRDIDENWYKRAVELAYNAKSSAAYQLSRNWVRAYPTDKNWEQALGIYLYMQNRDPADLVDMMRLQAAMGAFSNRADYLLFADELVKQGYPGEALAVLQAGVDAQDLDPSQQSMSELMALVKKQSGEEKGSLDADASAALSASDAKRSMAMGDVMYGYGRYDKAAELYRASLDKSGVDANAANLRLGMSLARSGDYAGAKAALGMVEGKYAEIAAYWMLWADLQG